MLKPQRFAQIAVIHPFHPFPNRSPVANHPSEIPRSRTPGGSGTPEPELEDVRWVPVEPWSSRSEAWRSESDLDLLSWLTQPSWPTGLNFWGLHI